MDPDLHLHHLRSDARLAREAAAAEPDAPVPGCPGWDRAKVIKHLCVPYGWVSAQLEAGPDDTKGFRDAERPAEGADLYDFFDSVADRLLRNLAATDMAGTWPTFAGPQPAAWFARRMAQETVIHRCDVAGGPIDAALSVDGIDEVFELFSPMVPADRFDGTTSTLHLHATDIDDGEWLATLGPDRLTSERRHAKGDAALRGTASDLYLFTWNRVPLDDRFEVIGDRAAAERWAEVVRV